MQTAFLVLYNSPEWPILNYVVPVVVTQSQEKHIQSVPLFHNFQASKQHNVLKHFFTSAKPSYNLLLKC